MTGPGSTWIANSPLEIGYNGRGTLTISNGGSVSVTGSNTADLGGDAIGIMTVTGSGSTFNASGDFFIGDSGSASLTVSNGGTVTSGQKNFGATLGAENSGIASVTVTGSGSKWTDNGDLFVGSYGNATLLVSAGGVVTNADINDGAIIANQSGGGVTVTGPGSKWIDNGDLTVGDNGHGTLTISNGALVFELQRPDGRRPWV